MRWIDQLRIRLRTLFLRGRIESELNREFQFHLDEQIAENITAGMPPDEARYAALRRMGRIALLQERCREERGMHWLEVILQDVRYAFRSLGKTPAFTLVAVLSLALGIGANTAIFSLIDSVLLSGIPVKDPQQLVFVRTNRIKVGNFQVSTTILNRDVDEMRRQATQVEGIASSQKENRLSIALDGRAELAAGDFVSGNYFQLLGVTTQIGRAIVPADDSPNGGADGGWPAVISNGYWERRFARDPNVLGRKITVNTIPFVIVGVLPAGFDGLSIDERADLMMPTIIYTQVAAGSATAGFPHPENFPGQILARIENGASPSKAAAELTVILRNAELSAQKLGKAQQESLGKRFIEFEPAAKGSSYLRQRFSEPLRVLMVVVALVMLIACANIAGLLMARASARQREIAIRLSLGSSRRRIIQQLLTESLMLSMLGCIAGIAFAIFARGITLQLGSGSADAASELTMPWDFRMLAFLAAVCVVNALLFGVMPALRAANVDPNDALKSSQSTQHSARLPLGRFLVAAQLALSLALVVGSGLFLATLRYLYEIDLGFSRENLLMATLDPHLAGFDSKQAKAAYVRMLQELKTLPSVTSVSLMNNRLLSGRAHLSDAKVPGYVPQPGEDLANSWTLEYDVGPRFFETVRMPLVAGRDFTERDDESSQPVVIVNEAMAKHFFAGKDPIGQKVLLSSILKSGSRPGQNAAEVVGLVRNAHYFDVNDEHQEAIFAPALQIAGENFGSEQTLLVRTTAGPAHAANDLRAVVRRIDRSVPVFDLTTMATQLDQSLSRARLMAVVSSFFGLLALTLSAIGLYGVLAYAVTKRTGEIGIRMALGADRGSILSLILGETMRLVSGAIAVGVALAWAASRLIKSMIYGVTTHDARVFVFSASLLLVVAVLAALLPARRAVRVDPMVALRCE